MSANSASPAPFLATRLGRRLLALLALVLTACSLLFLLVFTGAYREKLVADHTHASAQVNRVLGAVLLNTAQSHDAASLAAMLRELADQEDVAGVAILDSHGAERFSAQPGHLGGEVSGGKPLPGTAMTWRMLRNAAGQDVLRTVNPIAGQQRCAPCHAEGATIGTLVVDYAAADIGRETLRGGAFMALAGGFVLLSSLAALSYFLNRTVTGPIARLDAATAAVAAGDLAARVRPEGNTEIADLGRRFNGMADHLGENLDRLRRSETFLQRVIDAVPDGVRVIGSDFRILRVNAAYCRQLGVTPDQAVGTLCHVSSHHSDTPCPPGLLTCPLVDLKDAGRGELKCRHRHLRADGSEFFVEVSAARASLMQDGTEVPCVVESIRDLTEQAESSLQDRLAEIGQLATGIAHEIHNPLASIHLALAQAREAGGTDPAGFEAYLAIAAREIDRCLEVTGRLLKLSDPASDEQSLIDMAPLIADVTGLLSIEAHQRHVAIRSEIAGAPRVIANEGDIGIVILNLAQNAMHAMPVGGTLRIACGPRADRVELVFSDTGVGIRPEDIRNIFWPFWSKRADGSEGSGLGLSICKTMIERMHGTIAVASKPGAGTTFTITLPNPDHVTEMEQLHA